MREIKFRAWDKVNKKVRKVMSLDFYTTRSSEVTLVSDDGDAYLRYFEQIELMQYTGLRDKNGAEIYEGDIVEIVQPKQSNMWMGSSLLSSHSWENKYRNVVQWQNDNNPRWDGLLVWGGGTIEVLGNIYEHPELIKGERK